MSQRVTITINGQPCTVSAAATVAVAVLEAGVTHFRTSVEGMSRGPLCGMGICYECRLTIDGVRHVKSCQLMVRDRMEIRTDE